MIGPPSLRLPSSLDPAPPAFQVRLPPLVEIIHWQVHSSVLLHMNVYLTYRRTH